jgi:hypothetical protein
MAYVYRLQQLGCGLQTKCIMLWITGLTTCEIREASEMYIEV